MTASTSRANAPPGASRASTSSSTSRRTEERTRSPRAASAAARPGVAATSWAGRLSRAASAARGRPPMRAATAGPGGGGPRAARAARSAAVWRATSRVGDRTRTCVIGRAPSTSPAAMTPNAAVLPVPDRARTRRSAPARPSGMAAAWWVSVREGEGRGEGRLERGRLEVMGEGGDMRRVSPTSSLSFHTHRTCTGDGSRKPASAKPSSNHLGRRRSAKEGAAAAASAVRGRRRRGAAGALEGPGPASSAGASMVARGGDQLAGRRGVVVSLPGRPLSRVVRPGEAA